MTELNVASYEPISISPFYLILDHSKKIYYFLK